MSIKVTIEGGNWDEIEAQFIDGAKWLSGLRDTERRPSAMQFENVPEEPAELVQMAAQIFETLPTSRPTPIDTDVRVSAAPTLQPPPEAPRIASAFAKAIDDESIQMTRATVQSWRMCSHNLPMKRWPAGVNKQGKPYNASWRPDHRDCTDKAIWDRDAA